MLLSRGERRARLQDARLLLIFTPELAGDGALGALERALPFVDVVQVRPKVLGDRAPGAAPGASITRAGDAVHWCREVLTLRSESALERPPLVVVNDRVDVAAALAAEGLDGVHVGADDTPPSVARQVLGPDQVIGLSTHSPADLAAASAEVPLFPIGGIDLSNADQLDRVGRAAVGSAILGAGDPGLAARGLRSLLEGGDE